jgi:hypothetical protein
MFKKFRLYRQFKKEVDKTALYNQAVEWTKDYFKRRGVPNWSSEYQNTFTVHTLRYCNSYLNAYAKRRYAEHLAQK